MPAVRRILVRPQRLSTIVPDGPLAAVAVAAAKLTEPKSASGSAWGLGLGLLLGCIVAFGVYRVGLKLRGD